MFAAIERWSDFLADGGFVMPFLLLGAALLWFSLGYRWLTLRRGSRAGLRRIIDGYRREPSTPTRGLVCAAARRGVAITSARPENLRRALDVALYEHLAQLGRFETLVKAMVMVAPLTGLLGTVSGMMETFSALGDMSLFSQSGGIAGGISEALISTQMGLSVAIPGLLVGRLLQRRQQALAAEVAEIKDILCGDAPLFPAAAAGSGG